MSTVNKILVTVTIVAAISSFLSGMNYYSLGNKEAGYGWIIAGIWASNNFLLQLRNKK